jgi:serine/threonine protein kinase
VHADLTLGGPDGDRKITIRPGQRYLVGRGSDAVVRLAQDPQVSRHHVALELRTDGLHVTDLGSSNGTRLELLQLTPQQPVLARTGDQIQVGAHTIRVELSGFDAEALTLSHQHRLIDQPLLPADELTLLEPIGQGGMGRVWAAWHKPSGRRVAIKVLHAEVDWESEAGQRFLREGSLCKRVRSPHVVELYDMRRSGRSVYLVMELVDGPSAFDHLNAVGPLPIPEALTIGEHVARALDVAARVGVIHRDVKPQNILLTHAGVAKLGDFGLAKDLADDSLTHTGALLGSLSYAAPEQVEDAKHVTRRTDVYGLGATLYHLITGQPPLSPVGRNLIATVRRILEQTPAPARALRPDCPQDVERLLARMLEKDPTRRPPHPAQIAARLLTLRRRHYPDYEHVEAEGSPTGTWTDLVAADPSPPPEEE